MKKLLIILLLLCLTANVGQSQYYPVKMFGQQPSGQYAEGLIGFWRFIEAGALGGESFFGNNGTINGATWEGDSLLFDENNPDSVTFATPPKSVTKQGTVVFSFFPTGNTGNFDRIFDHRNAAGSGVYFQYRADADRITFNVVNTDPTIKGLSVSGVFPEDEWHCVAFTWTQFFRAAYRNGQLVASNSDDMGTPRDLDAALTFMLNVNGNLKDVLYYDHVLSPEEIQALFLNPDLPMQQEPIWLFFSPAVGGIDIGALMQSIREDKTGGKQGKSGGKK